MIYDLDFYHPGLRSILSMSESIAKFFIVFIIGVVVIAIGMALSLLTIVLLGGLLSGVSALIMLVCVLADRTN